MNPTLGTTAPTVSRRPEPGLGVPCGEAQCDGVPCPEVNVDCNDCERVHPQVEPSPKMRSGAADA